MNLPGCRPRGAGTRASVGAAALLALLGCAPQVDDGDELRVPAAGAADAGRGTGDGAGEDPGPVGPSDPTVVEAVEPDLDLAVSEPVEDSVYPAPGDPGVDALHYGLDLDWAPGQRRLEATATVTFRATATAPRIRLALGAPLRVGDVTLDGEPVPTTHRGDQLVVRAPVEADGRYELVVPYSGTPEPTPAPTTRGDFSTLGFTVTDAGEVWTMQEPYGAFTWYPVNDQPADKALYDVTVHAPAPWTGISNGRLTRWETGADTTTTSWQLTEPASSYLVTLAIGDYEHRATTSTSGVVVDHWTPRGLARPLGSVLTAAASVDWIEDRLGPYPFDSLGLVVVDSLSAMETQTMVTLGATDYVLSEQVVAHELVHQWYGDQVSPSDWRDVWLNEGMTMLLQWMYEGDRGIAPLRLSLQRARSLDQDLRDAYGPPGDYRPGDFGTSNVYYCPALMWNELRVALGDEEFFRIARAWLAARDNTAVSREQVFDFWEAETGLELTDFFDAWITGARTPARGVPGVDAG